MSTRFSTFARNGEAAADSANLPRRSPEQRTDKESAYLTGQRLGRLATVRPDGRPHVVPTGFRLADDRSAVEIGGHRLAARRPAYLRNIEAHPWVAFVVDDLAAVNPWTPRGLTIRGRANILPEGGQQLGPGFDTMPTRITSWGIDSGANGPPNGSTVGSPRYPPRQSEHVEPRQMDANREGHDMSFDTRNGTRGARQPGGRVMVWMTKLMTKRVRRTGRGPGFNALVLTTVGRKSGTERETPVGWFPGTDGSYLIVASAAGAARNPAWYYNLAAHPDRAQIETGDGRKIPVTARELHGTERDEAWRQITVKVSRFAEYQRKTDRELPVIRLVPHSG